MRIAAIFSALALTLVAPTLVRAQINPLQAAGIAESVAGIVIGTLYPAPRCGPHDAPPPRYQPAPAPRYVPPPPRPDQSANIDDDDDDDYRPLQPRLHRHLNADSAQPQTRPYAEEESDQTAELRSRDDNGQPANEAAMTDDDEQPAQVPVAHRAARRYRPAQTQSSGQVAEIPSQPRVTQPSVPQH